MGHGRDEELGFAAFEVHYFPYFGEGEDGGGGGGVDGVGLGLVEDDHCGWVIGLVYWVVGVWGGGLLRVGGGGWKACIYMLWGGAWWLLATVSLSSLRRGSMVPLRLLQVDYNII